MEEQNLAVGHLDLVLDLRTVLGQWEQRKGEVLCCELPGWAGEAQAQAHTSTCCSSVELSGLQDTCGSLLFFLDPGSELGRRPTRSVTPTAPQERGRRAACAAVGPGSSVLILQM